MAGVLVDKLALFADPARGNKWKATVGWFRIDGKRASKGRAPLALLFKVFIFSDMKLAPARSKANARRLKALAISSSVTVGQVFA